MESELDHTHNKDADCWVRGASDSDTEFPIQNLPFGVYRKKDSVDAWRGCVAIEDFALDLAAVDA